MSTSFNNRGQELLSNKSTDLSNNDNTHYPTTQATQTAINNAISGINPAIAANAATVTILPNTPTYNNGASGVGATLISSTNSILVVDGYTPALLDRILVKDQVSSFQNGLYYVSQLGTGLLPWILIRALDYNSPSNINNTGSIPIENNGTNSLTSWLLVSHVTTIGTDALLYNIFTINPNTVVSINGTQILMNKTLDASNKLRLAYITKTATYAINAATDYTINCTSGTFNVTLPTAIGITGQEFEITNTGTGIITILTTSGQTIDGISTFIIYQFAEFKVKSDGANWIVTGFSFLQSNVFSYDTTTQTVGTANTFQDITFDTNIILINWTHTLSTASFTCGATGIYLIQIFPNMNITGGAPTSVELRVVKNGTEIPGSQIYQEIQNNAINNTVGASTASQINNGDIIKFQLTGGKTTSQIQSGVGNATTKQSIKITINRIS